MKKFKKICRICGEEFLSLNVRKVFCSNACRVKSSKVNNKKEYSHTCKNCEKIFVSTERKTKFCSAKCAGIYKNKKGTGKTKKCKNCEKSFEQKHNRHFFCSKYCKSKFNISESEKVNVSCSNCGNNIERNKYGLKDNSIYFCSKKCESEYRVKSARDVRKCEMCEKDFICKKSDKLRFCSVTCQSEWQRVFRSGENHPSYKHEITSNMRIKKCEFCGAEMIGTPKRFETQKYCSYSCKTKDNPKTMTFPHRETIRILEELEIPYETEYRLDRYSIDCVILDSNLLIEVMGTFWHCDRRVYLNPVDDIQIKSIIRDKKKNRIIKSKGYSVLYVWEKDISEDYETCKKLISEYFERNGKLKNYHSGNYLISKNKLKLRSKIFKPFFEQI